MAGEINGSTDQMQRFNPTPPDPSVASGARGGGTASGGMPEGIEFAKAEVAAAQELAKFITDTSSGFAAYAAIAVGSAADYLRGDGNGANAISQAPNASMLNGSGGH